MTKTDEFKQVIKLRIENQQQEWLEKQMADQKAKEEAMKARRLKTDESQHVIKLRLEKQQQELIDHLLGTDTSLQELDRECEDVSKAIEENDVLLKINTIGIDTYVYRVDGIDSIFVKSIDGDFSEEVYQSIPEAIVNALVTSLGNLCLHEDTDYLSIISRLLAEELKKRSFGECY